MNGGFVKNELNCAIIMKWVLESSTNLSLNHGYGGLQKSGTKFSPSLYMVNIHIPYIGSKPILGILIQMALMCKEDFDGH